MDTFSVYLYNPFTRYTEGPPIHTGLSQNDATAIATEIEEREFDRGTKCYVAKEVKK